MIEKNYSHLNYLPIFYYNLLFHVFKTKNHLKIWWFSTIRCRYLIPSSWWISRNRGRRWVFWRRNGLCCGWSSRNRGRKWVFWRRNGLCCWWSSRNRGRRWLVFWRRHGWSCPRYYNTFAVTKDPISLKAKVPTLSWIRFTSFFSCDFETVIPFITSPITKKVW